MTPLDPRPYTPRADLRDVTLRDGLQLTAKMLPTERKVEIARELLALGVPALEIGSMARPDLVPPLADTIDVITALTPDELDRCWIWVATPRHVEKAAAAGTGNTASRLQIPTTKPTSGAAPRTASRRCRTQSGSPARSAEPSSCASPRRSPARSRA